MEIITESIKNDVEIQLNKDINEITEDELTGIKQITISRLGFDSEIQAADYDEIKYFENLEELTIFNCMINENLMDHILGLKKLKKLKVYDCDFVDFASNLFDNLQIEELVVSNCLGVTNVALKGLMYLELKNMKMDCLIKNIGILNIANIGSELLLGKLENVKKVIISEEDYNRDKRIVDLPFEIVVIDERMNIVEEIKK